LHDVSFQMASRSYLGVRRTNVVRTKLAAHMLRVHAARSGENGAQILTMAQLAARLAGGFLRPIDPEALRDAVRASLASIDLGELEPIKNLPGMVRAAVGTLDKVWHAAIDLSVGKHPRLQAVRSLEQEVLRRLPPAMLRPRQLVELACAHIEHAKKVIGSVEIHGHSDMLPCWRPLLQVLTETVPVTWCAGPRPVPDWLRQTRADIRVEAPAAGEPVLFSCAHPQHEVLEAFRWMRELLASGAARPEDIAIAATAPADFDDHVLALSRDADIPIHFVHGIKAVTGRDGQTAAALAEVLIKGISQERGRRLFGLLHGVARALRDVPPDWMRILPTDAPLTKVERWEQVFGRTSAGDWPSGIDRSAILLGILRLLARGPQSAAEAGEKLLSGTALALWRRGLGDGPAQALTLALGRLRVDDRLEPASHVIWASATALASSPRPYVRLLALNAGRWPRRTAEDSLIPDHVISIAELDPLPAADSDAHDYAAIVAAAKSAALTYSRRDVEGRLLGRSPLVRHLKEIYLGRARIPKHAASESDRLLARPAEFQTMPMAISGLACWRNWWRGEITPHDGLIGRPHPRLQKVFEQAMSASSLKLLLRDPIRFLWRYALGWKQPDEADEPLTIDALAFGSLVHSVLCKAVDALESAGTLAAADPTQIEQAIRHALEQEAKSWEIEQPVPPKVIWHNTLDGIADMCCAALRYPLEGLPAQKTFTEIPFGTPDRSGRKLPWDPTRAVEIPGTGIRIQGYIDRLDLSGNAAQARVIDYKTGKLDRKMGEVVVNGGGELQRCLYAFAVKTLVNSEIEVQSALLYPGAGDGEQALFPLADVETVLARLRAAIGLARDNMANGIAPPGVDADDKFNELSFALPGSKAYLARKIPFVRERLGEAAKIWDEP
jgi:hypothetical protein